MITSEEIRKAALLIEGRVIRTPLVRSPTFSRMADAEVYLKLECLQMGGSFKVRGATYKVLKRREEIGPAGVVAASAGNHAQGVALAAKAAGLPATIVMPVWASMAKQEATRGYGAEVILAGDSLAESISVAQKMAADGRTFIHPYDDLDIITGQGTIGLEILEDLPDPDLVIVPIGGGGAHQRDSDGGEGGTARDEDRGGPGRGLPLGLRVPPDKREGGCRGEEVASRRDFC